MTYFKKIKNYKIKSINLAQGNIQYARRKRTNQQKWTLMNHIISTGTGQPKQMSNKADWTLEHKQLEWPNKYVPAR